MAVQRDPDKKPEVTEEMLRAAQRVGKKIVCVTLDPPGAKVGDSGGVSFFALVDFLPRVGESLWTNEGQQCQVRYVDHKIVNMHADPSVLLLMPNVYAVLDQTTP